MKKLSISDAAELVELRIRANEGEEMIAVCDPDDWQFIAMMGNGPITVEPSEDPVLDIIKNFGDYGSPSIFLPTNWATMKREAKNHFAIFGAPPRLRHPSIQDNEEKEFGKWISMPLAFSVVKLKSWSKVNGTMLAHWFGEAQAQNLNAMVGIPQTLDDAEKWTVLYEKATGQPAGILP